MKKIVILLILAVVLSLILGENIVVKRVSANQQVLTEATIENTFILNNVHIVDVGARQIAKDKQVYVNNGRVIHVENASHIVNATIPIIDGKGGYVTPGLIDMHVHMYESAAFTFALSHGVTHVRIMNGIPAQLRWRDQVASGELIGSSATVSSPILSAYEGAYLHHTVLTPSEVKQAVKQYHSAGYDLIKAYGNLSEEVLAALVEESTLLQIPVAKHGPHASGAMPVKTLKAFQSFEHVEDIFQGPLNYQHDLDALHAVIAELKDVGVPITATLNIYNQLTQISAKKEAFLQRNVAAYTSPIIALEAKHNQVKRWLSASDKMAAYNQRTLQFLLAITGELHKQGVTLLVGSDSGVLLSPHGLATHTELQLLQQAGLSAFDALAAATINPAKALGFGSKMGQIATGFDADFIFTQYNPIEDLQALENPDAVVKSGNWYGQEELKQLRLQAIDNRSVGREMMNLFEAL